MKRVSPLYLALVFLLAAPALFSFTQSAGTTQTGSPQNSASRNKAAQDQSKKRGLEVEQAPGKQSGQNKTGQDRTKPREIELSSTANPALNGIGAQSFALVIGISTYKNLPAKAQLRFADEDAKSLRDFLVSPKGGFRPENVVLLANEQATWQQIFRELEQLQNRSGPGSLAFIFFAGHGVVNRSGQGFLLAYDSQPTDLLVTSVEMNRLNSVLRNIRARSTVIFSDACHSGTIGDLFNQPGSNELVTNVTAKAFTDPSARGDQSSFIFSAASPSQSSFEMDSLKHGLFTYHVLQALDGKADRNGDGLVDAKELYDYVAVKVRQEAEGAGGSQVPEFNPFYDRSIPLSFLNEGGMNLYKQWFDTDPIISRYLAFFDEALKENRLTKPERQSAWDYYNFLNRYVQTPPEVVRQKREELVTRLGASAQAVIDQSPSDPAQWNEAGDWLDKAYEVSHDKALRAKQSFCTAMMHHFSGDAARAEKECDIALNIIEENRLNEPVLCLRVGQFYKRLSRWEKARQGYKLAVEANPKLEWLSEYGEVLVQSNDLAEAETQLRRVQQMDPNYWPGLRLLAEVLLRSDRKERFAEALEVASRAREVKPDDMDIEDVYGWALLKSGDTARAIEPLRKVAQHRLADDKRRDNALLRVSLAYSESGELYRAISALREAEQRGSRRTEIYDELSRLLKTQGDLHSAIAAAEKAAALTQNDKASQSKRLHTVAEYLERTGRLDDAAFKYREASLLATDARVNTSLENRARVLFHRAGRPQDAGPLPKRYSSSKPFSNSPALLIAPGGRKALEYLTGVRIDPSNEDAGLAIIFDTCLRDSTIKEHLIDFYEMYLDLVRKLDEKGVKVGDRLELPAAGQPLSEAAKEALKFFGINEKRGGREINEKEFESKKRIVEALGGDSKKLGGGQVTTLKLKNDELSILFGMDQWIGKIKDAAKARPEAYLLAFLKDEQSMQLYVGLSMLPEHAAQWATQNIISKDNAKDIGLGLYFAAPYLRFTQQGALDIPGQSQGLLKWQKILGTKASADTLLAIFKRDNSESLYLLAALSSAGEVGNLIARSPLFEQFYRLLKDEKFNYEREPFDLMDIFAYLRIEGDKLRLSKPVEAWVTSEQRDADPLSMLLSKIGKSAAGQEIMLVKQVAVLDQIERERPDWLSDVKTIDFIAKQVATRREPELEVALDLYMNWPQVERYFERVARIDAISTPPQKQAVTRTFQSAFELFRIMARNASVNRSKIDDLVDSALKIDPGSELFVFDLVRVINHQLLRADAPLKGEEIESKLLASVAHAVPLVLQKRKTDDQAGDNSKGGLQAAAFYQFDSSKADYDRMARLLGLVVHTRLRTVVDAMAALDALEKNPSDAAALGQLKAAVEKFIESEPPAPPKKGKPKQPASQTPSLKQVVAQLTGQVDSATVAEIRHLLTPFVGEALLGMTYVAMLNPTSDETESYASLARNHDLGNDPWGEAEFDHVKGAIRGNVARLSRAIAQMESRSLNFGRPPSIAKAHPATPLAAVILNSYQLANHWWATDRAGEYVSRSIDLGEDVMALSLLGDPAAQSAVNRLEEILSPRRAYVIRAWLDQAETKKAVGLLSLSELYYLGQRYLRSRFADATPASLVNEPGALGILAALIAKNQSSESLAGPSEDFRRELRQFGMTMTARKGLLRLDLPELEPYEKTLMFHKADRMLERVSDFKLAMVRACYRRGFPWPLSFDSATSREVFQQLIAESNSSMGGTPSPERDWRDLLTAIQVIDDSGVNLLINKLIVSTYSLPLPDLKWNDQAAQAAPSSTESKKQ